MELASAVELEQRALSVPEQARELEVRDGESYVRGGELLLTIKELARAIAETFDPIIAKAHAAHREAIAQKQKFTGPLAEAEAALKRKLADFDVEQERLRRVREAELEAAASRARDDATIAEAAALEAAGETVAATEVLAAPTFDAPIVLQKETPKISGISTRENWKFCIVNEAQVPREYLKIDEAKIGGVVRALKGSTKIPGVEVYRETTIAAGRRG
jgi:hypothetical protein